MIPADEISFLKTEENHKHRARAEHLPDSTT